MADGLLDLAQIERLHQIGGGSELARGDGVLQLAMRGDDDDRDRDGALADFREHIEAAEVGEADVEDGEAELAAAERIESGASARAEFGLPAEALAHAGERGGEGGFVFDDENGGHLGFLISDF